MAVITPDKTNSIDVLTHQAAVHPITIVGNAISMVTKRAVEIYMYHGYVEATADTNPGTFKVQKRPDPGAGSVNENWVTVAEYVVSGTTPDSEQPSGAEAAGQTVIEVASTAGFVAEDLIYFQDAGVVTDGEWGEVQQVVAGVSIDLLDGIARAKDAADFIFNDANTFVFAGNFNANESFRVVWSHEGATGANGHVKVIASTYDSDTSV